MRDLSGTYQSTRDYHAANRSAGHIFAHASCSCGYADAAGPESAIKSPSPLLSFSAILFVYQDSDALQRDAERRLLSAALDY
jgi:hypothetical protein